MPLDFFDSQVNSPTVTLRQAIMSCALRTTFFAAAFGVASVVAGAFASTGFVGSCASLFSTFSAIAAAVFFDTAKSSQLLYNRFPPAYGRGIENFRLRLC